MKICFCFILYLALSWPAILTAQKPELVTVKDGHIGPVIVGCFAPDERQALTGGRDRRVVLWDLTVAKYVRHFETPEVPLQLAFTKNGRSAIVLMYDRLQLWDLEVGNLLQDFALPDYDQPLFKADTLWLAKDSKPVAGWAVLEDHIQPFAHQSHTWPVIDSFSIDAYPGLASRMHDFAPDENAFVTYIPSRKLGIIYGGKTTGYWMVTPGAPMNRSGSGFIMVWDLLADKAIDSMVNVPEQIINIAVNERGTLCLVLSEDKKVYHFDIIGSKIIHTFEKENSKEVRFRFSRDFAKLAMIDYHGNLRVWPIDQRNNIIDFSKYLDSIGTYNGRFGVETALFSHDHQSIILGNRIGELIQIPFEKPMHHVPYLADPHLGVIQDLIYSPDGGSVLAGSSQENRVMMMYADKLPKEEFEGYVKDDDGNIIGMRTSRGPRYGTIMEEDNQQILWSPNHNSISLWDATSKSLQQLFYPYQVDTWVTNKRLAYSPAGNYAFLRINDRWHAWEATSGDIMSPSPAGRPINAFYFRGNDGYALTIEEEGQVSQWQIGQDTIGSMLPGLGNIIAIGCDESGNFCWLLNDAGGLMKWNTKQQVVSHQMNIDRIPDNPELMSTPDANYVILRSEGAATLINIGTGNTVIHLERDSNDVCEGDLYYDGRRASDVSTFMFMPDGIHALSATYDGNIKIWKYRSGEVVANISFLGEADWVVSTSEGLFDATEGAMRQMYFRIGTEVIELEQLKERYFEPGLLQKILGFTPGGVRPVAHLANIALYPQITSILLNGDHLQVSMKPRDGGIGRVALLLNHNIELQANINPDFTQTFNVDLSTFKDYFSTTEDYTLSLRAYNQEGWLKSPSHIIRDATSGAKGGIGGNTRSLLAEKDTRLGAVHLYALVVGTSTYRGEQLNLKYPDKDALSLSEALRITAEPLFGTNVSITTLTTDGPTWPRKQEIARAFSDIASVATPNDILLVYLSGHGITYPPNSEKGQFYYLTTDILSDKLDDPLTRTTQAIGQDTLQEWIRQVKALKRILILDACNSGKVVESLSVGEKSLNSDQRRALERMYDRSGMFVLAGSAGDKLSFEASQFGHGLLTYSLLNNIPKVAATNNTYVDVGKLFNNALEEVPRLAHDIGKYQQPELIGNSSFDIGILAPHTPFQVPQPLPVFLRPSFLNIAGNRDNYRLSGALSKFLDELAKEPQAQMAFWDIDDFQGNYYYIGGTYTTSNDQIKCDVSVYDRNTLVAEFTVNGRTATISALAEEIAQTAFTRISQLK